MDAPPPGTTAADAEEDTGISLTVLVVVPETEWPDWPSTGFLERWRPLFICRSQYLWSAIASLEHRHFLPSVRRHLPGSGSVLLENPRWKAPHPTAITTQRSVRPRLKPKSFVSPTLRKQRRFSKQRDNISMFIYSNKCFRRQNHSSNYIIYEAQTHISK